MSVMVSEMDTTKSETVIRTRPVLKGVRRAFGIGCPNAAQIKSDIRTAERELGAHAHPAEVLDAVEEIADSHRDCAFNADHLQQILDSMREKYADFL